MLVLSSELQASRVSTVLKILTLLLSTGSSSPRSSTFAGETTFSTNSLTQAAILAWFLETRVNWQRKHLYGQMRHTHGI